MSELTKPAVPRTVPIIPSGENACRTPEEVTRGLGLGADDTRRLETQLREWAQDGSVLSFRKSLMRALRSMAGEDPALRMELGRRALTFWKSTASERFDRRPGREGQRLVIQKAEQSINKSLRLYVELSKSKQLRMFGESGEPTKEAKQPTKRAPARHGGPFIGPRGGKWADAAHTIPWKPVKAGQSVRAEAIEATPEKRRPGVKGTRGAVFAELKTSPSDWEALLPTGFVESGGKGAPVYDFPKDYRKPKTMFGAGGGGEKVPCQICGTDIKNVFYLQHHGQRLILGVGSECITKYAEAHMPKAADAIKKVIRAKVKPHEVDSINRLMADGHSMEAAVSRVRAVTNGERAWAKKYPKPTEEQALYWNRIRPRIRSAIERRSEGEWLSPGDFALLRDQDPDRQLGRLADHRLNPDESLDENYDRMRSDFLREQEIRAAIKHDGEYKQWASVLEQHRARGRSWNRPEDERPSAVTAEMKAEIEEAFKTAFSRRHRDDKQGWIKKLSDLVDYAKEQARNRIEDEMGVRRTGTSAKHARRQLTYLESNPKQNRRSVEYYLEALGPVEQAAWRKKHQFEKSISDADLDALRPRLVLRETSHPLELIWIAEEVPDELHERYERRPPGWPSEDGLAKGAGHKYIRRIPTGKLQPKYRYIYRVPKQRGLVADEHLVEGTKFKVEHQGEAGHFEVRAHHAGKGVVTVRHDESGRTVHLRTKDLQRMMQRQVGKKTREQLDKPRPLKLEAQETQVRLPGAGKTEQKFPEPEKPRKAAPKLKRASMDDLGKGGFDNIEGFSQDPAELERQAQAMKGDREFAIIPQAGGFVLASKMKAPTGGPAVGESTEVLLRGTGRSIDTLKAEWAVVEADTIIASHDPISFAQRDDYPIGVQERPYHRDQSEQTKIEDIARELTPALVANTNPDAINGAPIVTEKGIVLGGNGRTMGMQRAYARYGESSKALKDHLMRHARAFGLSSAQIAEMKKPMLVRRVAADSEKEMTRLGRRMNEALTQGLDPRAAEVAVSKFVTGDVVDTLTASMPADIPLNTFLHRPASKPFIEAVKRAGIIDERNENQFVNAETGLLNEDGRERVQRVMAARMIPDADLLDSMNQSWRESLAQAVPYFLQAESADWDLRPALTAAVKADADMQSKGFKRNANDRKAYLAQLELTATAMRKPEAEVLLEMLHTVGGNPKILARGMKQIALEAARQQHDFNPDGTPRDMFARPKVSVAEALRIAFPTPPEKKKKKSARAPEMAAAAMARSLSGWGDLLIKSGQVGAQGLSAYVMHAVNWELDNLLRGAIAIAKPGKALDGQKILAKLRAFIVDQAHRDKDFARGMGVQPLDSKVLEGLVQAHAKARVAEIAKSLAKSLLWQDMAQVIHA